MENIILFKGKDSPLSNLHIIEEKLVYKGIHFNSSEQAYQWEKCIFHNNHTLANLILEEKDPYKQMKIGGLIIGNPIWQDKKRDCMREILKFKLIDCETYRAALKESKDSVLIENTNHPFWGRGKSNLGKNNLGALHCEIRSISGITKS